MKLQQQLMQLEMLIHMTQMKCNFTLMGDEKIHPGQIAFLMTMRKLGPTNQRNLAKSMNCSPASVGVSVKRLEKAGLLEKQTDMQDLRTTRVALTEQGEEFAKKCEDLVNAVAEEKYNGFCLQEMEQLKDYLIRIKANLEEFHEGLMLQKLGKKIDERGCENQYGADSIVSSDATVTATDGAASATAPNSVTASVPGPDPGAASASAPCPGPGVPSAFGPSYDAASVSAPDPGAPCVPGPNTGAASASALGEEFVSDQGRNSEMDLDQLRRKGGNRTRDRRQSRNRQRNRQALERSRRTAIQLVQETSSATGKENRGSDGAGAGNAAAGTIAGTAEAERSVGKGAAAGIEMDEK